MDRTKALRLRAEQKRLDVDDETLRVLAKDAFERRENIWEMDHGLVCAKQIVSQIRTRIGVVLRVTD